MRITKKQLKLVIERLLLEEDQKKLFKGEYYSFGEIKGSTLIYTAGNIGYFLLPKNSEGKKIGSFKLLTYDKFKTIKNTSWVSDLDDYSDFSQNAFFKHMKNKRVVYGILKQAKKEQSKEEDVNIGGEVANTAFEASIAVASLFPATTGYSVAASIGKAVESLIKDDIPNFIAWSLSAIPGLGGPIKAALKPLMTSATKKAAVKVLSNSESFRLGINSAVESIESNSLELKKTFEEMLEKAKKKNSKIKYTSASLYTVFLKFFVDLVEEVEKNKK